MNESPKQSAELQVALRAAAAAAEISRGYYRSNIEVTTKSDRTPVTQADVECDKAIRDIILEAFPDHGFYGEETGKTQVWLVASLLFGADLLARSDEPAKGASRQVDLGGDVTTHAVLFASDSEVAAIPTPATDSASAWGARWP